MKKIESCGWCFAKVAFFNWNSAVDLPESPLLKIKNKRIVLIDILIMQVTGAKQVVISLIAAMLTA